MSAIKYLVPALAAVKYAAAQSCSASATTTVQNQGDAGAIAACQTFSGSVAVSSDAPSTLSFDGSLSTITGNFIINNATNLNSLSASGLQTVGKTFGMNGLTVLSSLNMPELTVANIDWITLPALQTITFGSFQNASSVNIQDTSLQKLDQLNVKTADTVNIANNPILTSIDWQITNCTTSLSINSNNENGGLNTSFPNLVGVGAMEIRNVSSLEIGSLAMVNGSLIFAGNTFEELALPNLTDAKGLAVMNNPSLKNFTAPKLSDNEGAFVVVNNDKLGGVLSFPDLVTIRGALNFTGAFNGLDMPKVNLVQGSSTVVSSQPLGSTCEEWGPSGTLASEGIIKSKPICESTAENSSGGSSSGSGSSSSSSSTPNAAVSFDPSAYTYTGVIGVVAAIFGML